MSGLIDKDALLGEILESRERYSGDPDSVAMHKLICDNTYSWVSGAPVVKAVLVQEDTQGFHCFEDMCDMPDNDKCEVCKRSYEHGFAAGKAQSRLEKIFEFQKTHKRVVHGEWAETGEYYEDTKCIYQYWQCSACGNEISGRYGLHNYCPNCGAKMDKNKEENK